MRRRAGRRLPRPGHVPPGCGPRGRPLPRPFPRARGRPGWPGPGHCRGRARRPRDRGPPTLPPARGPGRATSARVPRRIRPAHAQPGHVPPGHAQPGHGRPRLTLRRSAPTGPSRSRSRPGHGPDAAAHARRLTPGPVTAAALTVPPGTRLVRALHAGGHPSHGRPARGHPLAARRCLLAARASRSGAGPVSAHRLTWGREHGRPGRRVAGRASGGGLRGTPPAGRMTRRVPAASAAPSPGRPWPLSRLATARIPGLPRGRLPQPLGEPAVVLAATLAVVTRAATAGRARSPAA